MSIELNFNFKSDFQEKIFSSAYRHICGSGGYGNGKTAAGSLRSLLFLGTFPKYRMVIGRQKGTDLIKTTRTTFFNFCPPELYSEVKGGKRSDSQNYLRLINGSEVFWMHFDDYDEGSVRGLEVNSVLLDQAEEISENVYLHLDARIGRWSQAEVPPELLALNPMWPLHPANNKPRVPSWLCILCNPDVKTHWIFKRYHKDSLEYQNVYKDRYIMFEAETDPGLIDPDTYAEAQLRDPAWIERFFKGRWGISEGVIHRISDDSRLYIEDSSNGRTSVTREWLDNFLKRAAKYRVLDHGESAPTVVGWFAAYKGIHICYREYYVPNELISTHRQNIFDLSENESYQGNYGDPSIHHLTSQKNGGRWSVQDEYIDSTLCNAPAIYWNPADNNEFSNRNRINELLRLHPEQVNPANGKVGAPKLYFVMKSNNYPQGCYHIPLQTESQKRLPLVGGDNATELSDDRDNKIVDHGYDVLRYYVSTHNQGAQDVKPRYSDDSFERLRKNTIGQIRQSQMVEMGYYA